MVRPYRIWISTAASVCLIDAVLWFYAKSPRSRLNVMQIVFVVFFAIVMAALARVRRTVDSKYQTANKSILIPCLAILAGVLVWTTMLTNYFINDDFGLLYFSRGPLLQVMWSHFHNGTGIFYRPLGFSSYAWDLAVWGDLPVGFHLTNLLLHIGSLAGLYVMLKHLGIRRHTSALTVGIFAAMPAIVEPVAWMSGRFDVMTTTLAVWTIASYLWSVSRKNVIGFVIADVLYILAICTKETGFVIPLILIAMDFIIFRRRLNWRIGGFLVTGCLAFLYRIVAIGGIGGYHNDGGTVATDFSWGTIYGVFLRSPSQMLFGLNWMQPSGFLITTLAAVMSALILLIAFYAVLEVKQRRVIALALFWIVIAMLPAHFLSLIGPGLTNSRILCLPTVGMAIVLGQLLGSVRNPRFQTTLFILFVVVLNLGVLHNLAAWRWTSRLGRDTLQQIVKVAPAPPPNAQFVVADMPETVRGVLFFAACFNESLKLAYDRDDITAVRDPKSVTSDQAAAAPPRIFLTWKGKPEELITRQE